MQTTFIDNRSGVAPRVLRRALGRGARFMLFASAIAITAGCAAGIKGRADLPRYIEATDSQFADDIEDARGEATAAEKAYADELALASPNLFKLKVHRNDFAYSTMRAYELALQDYARDLSIEGRGGAFASKVALLGLGAAGAVAPEAILSTASTAITGLGDGYTEQLLVGNTVPVLLNNMVTAQLEQRAVIFERMKQEIVTYPLSAAKLDLAALARANTIETALARSAGDAEDKREEAADQEALVRTTNYNVNADLKKIQAWMTPDGKTVDPNRFKLVADYIKDSKIPNTDVTGFMSDANAYGVHYPAFIAKHGI